MLEICWEEVTEIKLFAYFVLLEMSNLIWLNGGLTSNRTTYLDYDDFVIALDYFIMQTNINRDVK